MKTASEALKELTPAQREGASMARPLAIGDRVKIVGPHPWAGHMATIASLEPPSLSASFPSLRQMVRLKLDDNELNESGCYASPSEFKVIHD